MRKYILAFFLLPVIAAYASAQDAPAPDTAGGVSVSSAGVTAPAGAIAVSSAPAGEQPAYAEDVSMRQSTPTFQCSGKALLTSGGKIVLLEFRMDAVLVVKGAIKDQFGAVKTPAVSVSDYMLLQSAPSRPAAKFSGAEMAKECEITAQRNHWNELLILRTRRMAEQLPN